MVDKISQTGQPAFRHTTRNTVHPNSGGGNQTASFGSMLQEKSVTAAQTVTTAQTVTAAQSVTAQSVSTVQNVTAQSVTAAQITSGIQFSKHALARAQERGIELTPTLMNQLAGSVEKAQEKGAKNILAFDHSRAFIINIPYGRVITTMSQEDMRENIFTNIDGAVLLS